MKHEQYQKKAVEMFNKIDKADLMKFIRAGITFDIEGASPMSRNNIALFIASLNDLVTGHRSDQISGLTMLFEWSQKELVTMISEIHRSGTKYSWDLERVLPLSKVLAQLLEIADLWYENDELIEEAA